MNRPRFQSPPTYAAPLGGMFTVPTIQHKRPPALSTTISTTHTSPNTHTHLKLLAAHSRARNRAVWSHALVLFNAIGIPLSRGILLEAQFTSMPNSSLLSLAATVGLQFLFVFCIPGLTGWCYVRSNCAGWWRSVYLLCCLGAAGAELAMRWVGDKVLFIMLLQGVVVPVLLGVILGLSWFVLARHYRWNFPLVSLQGWFGGFLGAVVYAIIARQGFAYEISAAVMLGTLGAAWMLGRPVGEGDGVAWMGPGELKLQRPTGLKKILKEDGTVWFVGGYIFVFFCIFVFPVYVTLVLTQPPTLYEPARASWALIAMLGTSSLSASISANPKFRRRLGPVDSFSAACVFAGAVLIAPIWSPFNIWLVIVTCCLYGVGLGAVIALQIKTATMFHPNKVVWHPDMLGRTAILMSLGGVAVPIGLLLCSWILESFENGIKIVIGFVAGSLVSGEILIMIARWKRCRISTVTM